MQSFHMLRTCHSGRTCTRPDFAFKSAATVYRPSASYAPPLALRTSSIVRLPNVCPLRPVVGQWNAVPLVPAGPTSGPEGTVGVEGVPGVVAGGVEDVPGGVDGVLVVRWTNGEVPERVRST